MEQLELTFRANNQCLEATNFTPPLFVASNTVDWIVAKFDLGTNWDCWSLGAVKAIWKFKGQQYSAILNAEGVCTIPHEVLGAMTGEVKVNLVASTIEDDEVIERLTTYPLYCINVNKVALIDGDNSVAITPSEYEQFVEDVQEYAQDAYDAKIGAEQSADSASSSAGIASDMADTATQAKNVAVQQAQLAVDAKEAAQTAQGLAESAKDSAVDAKERAESARDSAIEAKNAAQGYAENAESSASRIESLIPTPTEDGKILVTNDGEYEISELVTLTEKDHLYGAENTVTRPEGESFVVDVIGNNNTLDGSTARNRMFGADVVIGDYNQVKGETILSAISGHYNDIDGAYAGTIFGMQNKVKVPEGGQNQTYPTIVGSNNEVLPPSGEWYNDVTIVGNANKAKKRGQTLLGIYNEPIDDIGAIIVGDGTSENARHNAVVIKKTNGEYSAKLNNTEITESKLRELKAVMLPTDTASGAIASFPDGADDIPMSSVKASINPIQDLHGQSSPYPAGGGVNKFDQDTVYASYKQTDGSFIMTGREANNLPINIPSALVGQELTFSAYLRVPSGSSITNIRVTATVNGTSKDGNFGSDSNYFLSKVTFTPTSENDSVRISFGANGVQLLQAKDIQLEVGSTATPYAPYSNICPIYGRTEINTPRMGKNVIKAKYSGRTHNGITYVVNDDGTITASGTATATSYATNRITNRELLTRLPSGTYKMTGGIDSTKRLYLGGAYDDGTEIPTGYDSGSGVTYTLTEDAWVYPQIVITNGTSIDATFDVQLEVGTTATAYEPYVAPLTITTELGQTVYGGTLDVVSGVLTVTEGRKVFDGSEDEGWYSSPYNYYGSAIIADAINENTSASNQLCDVFPYGNITNQNQTTGICLIWGYIRVREATIGSLEDWKTYLSNNPMTVVYKLATPTTYQLTPQEVTSLLGGNTVWADSGNVEVTYKADIQKYIDKQISAVLNA